MLSGLKGDENTDPKPAPEATKPAEEAPKEAKPRGNSEINQILSLIVCFLIVLYVELERSKAGSVCGSELNRNLNACSCHTSVPSLILYIIMLL